MVDGWYLGVVCFLASHADSAALTLPEMLDVDFLVKWLLDIGIGSG